MKLQDHGLVRKSWGRTVENYQIVPEFAQGQIIHETCSLEDQLLVDVRTESVPCVEAHLQRETRW